MSFLRTSIAFLCIAFLISCSSGRKLTQYFKKEEPTLNFFKGFVLYNPVTKKELVNHNGSKYFTPASNTKLYTFYAAYKTLRDSVKAFEYSRVGDVLYIKGTADPSFFYGYDSTKVLTFLKKDSVKLVLIDTQIDEPAYGTGWAWDDYAYSYMPEKSIFPVYGNVLSYKLTNGNIETNIPFLNKNIEVKDSLNMSRAVYENNFYIQKAATKTNKIPFKTNSKITAGILSSIVDKEVTVIKDSLALEFRPFYNTSKDSLLKKMLVDSDNFIAEQLMLQVGKETVNTYSVDSAIVYSLQYYLKDLPDVPRWVDGSGLSRYNLFTPKDMVVLLDKMYREIPQEKLLHFFPVGGRSGTIKNWYVGEKPYVYAKTGTLSNNHNLSGYLITKKGTVLIFSYMNNHFKKSTNDIKKEMEQVLLKIYYTY